MAHPKPVIYTDYSDCPDFLKDFLNYQLTIRGLSARTVESYYIDLKLFFKYIKMKRTSQVDNDLIDEISISDISFDTVKTVTQSDILEFLYFTIVNKSG